MRIAFSNRKFAAFAAIVLGAAVLGGVSVPASHADTTPAVPAAPTAVTAVAASDGIKVSWTAPAANPAISGFVVSGGPGNCAIDVPAGATSAILPVLRTSNNVTPYVQAVNAYGFSNKAYAPNQVSLTSGLASLDVKALQVLQFSDFHGAIETSSTNIGAPVLVSAFNNDRALMKATVTVSSGDNFGAAPPISSQFEELPSVLALNAMGVDVSTFGNHEHDRNLDHLKRMIAASNFKWTVSNYSSLAGLQVKNNPVATYEIVKRGGIKLGVVGVNTSDTLTDIFPGNLDFTVGKKKTSINISDKVELAQQAVDAAKKNGADLVIVLLHNGWNFNAPDKAVGPLIDYSTALKGVAAVYGGHSHQKYASMINNTLVAEVRNSGVEYTRSEICLNTKTKEVIGASVDYVDKAAVTAAGFTADSNTQAMVDSYKSQLAAKMDFKIGSIADVAARGGTPAVERSGEAGIGSYTADALKARYKTDFALINGGGIRDTVPAKAYVPGAGTTYKRPATGTTGPYDVLLGDAYTVFPFGNTVSVVNITGKSLWAALENGVSQYPSAGRWPQIGGFKFTVDVSKPAFSRIVSVTKPDGTPIAADGTVYSVATVDYMVYGGDGYTQFDPTKQSLKDLLVDVFADALRADAAAGKVSKLATDGRETVIGK